MADKISNLFDFIGDVQIDVPKCPVSAIRRALIRTARNLINDSKVWEEELDYIDVVADQTEYTLPLKYDAIILGIVSLKVRERSDVDFFDLDEYDQSFYYFKDDDKIVFYTDDVAPQTSLSQGMYVKATLGPSFNCSVFPSWILERYGEGMIAGAKAMLMGSPGKPYSNPAMAMANQRIYNSALTNACNDRETKMMPETNGIGA